METHSLKNDQVERHLVAAMDSAKREVIHNINLKSNETEELRQAVYTDMDTLKEDMRRNKERREGVYNRTIDQLGYNVLALNQAINEESQERKATHNDILRSIRAMRDKFVHSIDVILK